MGQALKYSARFHLSIVEHIHTPSEVKFHVNIRLVLSIALRQVE